MKTRRFAKLIAAAILAVGVITSGVAPVGAVTAKPVKTSLTDTGWG